MFISKIYLLLISFFSVYLINKYRVEISNKINLVDKPDQIRKLHKKPTPLLGGTMIFSVFFFLNFISFLFEDFALTNIIIFLACFFLSGTSYPSAHIISHFFLYVYCVLVHISHLLNSKNNRLAVSTHPCHTILRWNLFK